MNLRVLSKLVVFAISSVVSFSLQCAPIALESAFKQSGLVGYCAVKSAEGLSTKYNFGLRDVANSLPYQTDTPQVIGSVSKTFIGLAIAQLVNQRKLDLDTDINSYLPFKVQHPKFKQTPITLRMLATHTAGIRDDMRAYRKSYQVGDQQALDTFAQFTQRYFDGSDKATHHHYNKHQPGSFYEYSNMGAALAALIIEQQSGMAFDTYVEQKILQPIGMQRSSFIRPASAALGYTAKPLVLPSYWLVTYPDGGLYSTCDDLARYLSAMLQPANYQLVEKDVALAFQPQLKTRPKNMPEKMSNSGLFWEIRGARLGHTGGDPGASSVVAIDPIKMSFRLQLTNMEVDEGKKTLMGFSSLWKALE
jgi:CubicO group peptidase (beta-lactamase class C family)